MKRHMIAATTTVALVVSLIAASPAGAQTHAKPHTFSFYARVVRSSSKGLQVRNSAGKKLFFSSSQIRKAAPAKPKKPNKCKRGRHQRKCNKAGGKHGGRVHAAQSGSGTTPTVTINIQGLQPGVTVVITETVDSAGNGTITITLPPSSATGEQNAIGVVTAVGADAFQVQLPDGSDLRLHMAQDTLANLNLSACDTVAVTYHQNAGILIADTVNPTGASTSGDCTPTDDATGTITSVSPSGLTISTDSGAMLFGVNSADITDGFQPGDVVDVTYSTANDGSQTAQDVEYVEEDATGTVTAVTPSSLTITDDATGQPDTFAPAQGTDAHSGAFDGVSVGDGVDVTFHVSAGHLVADAVDDGQSSGDQSGGDQSGGDQSGGDQSGN